MTSSFGTEGRNFEHITRIIFLSQGTNLTLLTRKHSDFSRYLTNGTIIEEAALPGKLGMMLLAFRWMIRNRRNLNHSIVLTEPSILGLCGFWARIISRCKWVVDVWDIPIRYTGKNLLIKFRIRLTKRLMRSLYRMADLFIVGIRTDMEFNYFAVPASKILAWQTTIWLPDKIPPAREKEGDGTFRIVCMKSEHKPDCGLDVLARAIEKIDSDIPDLRVWIIGHIQNEVRKGIQNLYADPRVTITGLIQHERVMELIQAADVCIIPWHNTVDLAQLYPTKVMEYLTEGKAVIASRVGNLKDMITDEENGLLFRPGDPDDLAAKILHLFRNPLARKRLELNARKYNEKFDTVAKNRCILKKLTELVEGGQRV